ncbi:MAG: glycosyltransferase 87 family protein [Oricola sp.]
MARITETLRTGAWLQKDRVLVYPLVILAITVASTAYVLASNHGTLPNGSPFGADFVSFWVAARAALAGHPDIPYIAERFAAAQDAIFHDGNFYAFYYPPHYLAYMAPFGALPFYAALGVWTGLSFIAALAVVMSIAGRRLEVVLLALAFPATFLTFAHGQNAFLSAALFGGALVLLPRRPALAGILFGLLTFKPQLGLLIPLALLAGGHWRAIASAIVTTLILAALSALLFGTEVWSLFLTQGPDAMRALRDNQIGWNKMISTYAAVRLSGLADAPAMAIQGLVSLTAVGTVVLAWRKTSNVPHHMRAALLLTASLLATPFGLNYDLFVLAPAIAFVAAHGMRHGFAPWTKTLLAIVYMSPFVVLWLMADGIPIAPFILLTLFAFLAVQAFGRGVSPAAIPAE